MLNPVLNICNIRNEWELKTSVFKMSKQKLQYCTKMLFQNNEKVKLSLWKLHYNIYNT